MNRNETEAEPDSSKAETSDPAPALAPGVVERQQSVHEPKVIKSGSLFLASRGIGWTSWKKRWFILSRTSLVFFRSDPNVVLPKGSEVNCTLGGFDLINSCSVDVNDDKKLITVQFPDGQNGHTVILKAETLEDLHEWKVALEEALANAPSAALSMGQSGVMKNDQSTDKPVKSMVIGRPVLLALEDIDGTPSFLEKALRFVEDQGVKVEGILRQAADVEHVESRIREYEQGKTEFSSEEDAHVIADCVKYVLRELPSSPVPASCCNALLEAHRSNRDRRLSAMRNAIYETFPEPNRRLLQRILTMMQTIAANKAQNRMSVSAVAACMAPLLLRPLLSGECELEQNSDIGNDSSAQLLQAAAAANHAQAICITLLEEYDNLFGVATLSTELYSETEDSGSESGELTEDDTSEGSSDYDGTDGSGTEHTSSGASSEAGKTEDDDTGSGSSQSSSRYDMANAHETNQKISSNNIGKDSGISKDQSNEDKTKAQANDYSDKLLVDPPSSSISHMAANLVKGIAQSARRPALWGRSSGRRNLSLESIDLPVEEEVDIQRLQATKVELQNRIDAEAKANEQLLDRLEKRKNSLHERRLILEEDVARLQEHLDKEIELRTALEAGLQSGGQVSASALINKRATEVLEDIVQTEVVVNNLKQKADDLETQLNQQLDQSSRLRQMKVKPKDVDSAATSIANKKKARRKSQGAEGNSSEDIRLVDHKSFPNSDELLSSPDRQRNLKPKDVDFAATTSNANKKKTRRKSQGAEGNSSEDIRLVDHKSSHNSDGESLPSPDKGRNLKPKDVDCAATTPNANKKKTRRKSQGEGNSSEDIRLVELKSSHNLDGESLSSPGRGRNLKPKDVDFAATTSNANKKKTRMKPQGHERKSSEDSILVDHKSSHNSDGESLSSPGRGRA